MPRYVVTCTATVAVNAANEDSACEKAEGLMKGKDVEFEDFEATEEEE